MKHRVAGRKLGRTSMHRTSVLRNLSTELFRHERIRTTLMKAKELRPFAERLITLAKRETLHARRLVLRDIHDRDVVAKMFDAISSRFAQRPGGYTRIVKLGPRRGDNSEMALIELIGAELKTAQKDKAPADADAKAGKASKKEAAAEKADKPAAKKKAAKSDDAAPKKASRSKGAPKPRTSSKGKSKAGAATRKVGKSGS